MSELAFAPLGRFADVVMGQSPGADLCNTEERGLPFLQGCAEFGARHPHSDVYCSPPLRVAKAGSVLISVRAPVGTMNYADQDYCIGRGLGAFKAKPGVSSTVFLKHAVELNAAYLHRRSQGSTFAAVSTDDVKTVPIPVFKPEKQEKIATILTGIDTAIEKTEALIAKYQQIKAGLMHDLFTRGVLPNGQLRPPREQAPELYQEAAIGWIPREWNKSDCSLEFAIESGITLGQHRRPSKRPRAYLRVANVHRDELRLEDLAYLEVLSNESVPTLQEFDLLIVEGHANRAEIGRCAMVTAEAAGLLFQNHLFRLRPHRLNHYYALDWLNSHYAMRHWETMCSTSSGLNTINRRMLGRMFVAVPSPDEQVLIAQKILGAKKRLGLEVQKLHKLRAQKSGLMYDLLTGKVPVKVEEPEVVDG